MKKFIFNVFIFIIGVLVGKYFFSEKTVENKEVVKIVTKEVRVSSLNEEGNDKSKNIEIKEKDSYSKRIDKREIRINKLFDEISSFDAYADRDLNMDVVTLYEEVLRLDPTNNKGLSDYSNYLIANGHMNEAKRVLEDCLRSHPNDELCLGNYTMFGIHDGDNMAVDMSINTCLERTPNNAKCIHNKGNSLLRRGEFQSAIETFKSLLNRENSQGKIIFYKEVIYHSIANAYKMANDLTNAKRYFKMACDEGGEYSCKMLEKL